MAGKSLGSKEVGEQDGTGSRPVSLERERLPRG